MYWTLVPTTLIGWTPEFPELPGFPPLVWMRVAVGAGGDVGAGVDDACAVANGVGVVSGFSTTGSGVGSLPVFSEQASVAPSSIRLTRARAIGCRDMLHLFTACSYRAAPTVEHGPCACDNLRRLITPPVAIADIAGLRRDRRRSSARRAASASARGRASDPRASCRSAVSG